MPATERAIQNCSVIEENQIYFIFFLDVFPNLVSYPESKLTNQGVFGIQVLLIQL